MTVSARSHCIVFVSFCIIFHSVAFLIVIVNMKEQIWARFKARYCICGEPKLRHFFGGEIVSFRISHFKLIKAKTYLNNRNLECPWSNSSMRLTFYNYVLILFPQRCGSFSVVPVSYSRACSCFFSNQVRYWRTNRYAMTNELVNLF